VCSSDLVEEQRIQVMQDGDEITLGNRQLRFMDTPGHARHHFCVYDSLSNGWFTGDTFGLSYREFDTRNGAFIFPTTTPVQFDPAALKNSINKLVADDPDCMYLTHYGRVDEVQHLAVKMKEGVDILAGIAETYKNSAARRQKIEAAISDWLLQALAQHGVMLAQDKCLQILQIDIELNTQGIEFWLDHR
jgi:glyoxylase-like metal-dependent hydrolase (beta-lactamase superfamily II)